MRTEKSCMVLLLKKFSCLILLLISSSFATAQAGRGEISGLVADSSGAIIPGATVTLKNTATGAQSTTKSTASGLFTFISLSPGRYEITANMTGFDTLVQKNVLVTVDQTTTINLSLKVGSVAQVVTVTDAPELVDTSNSTVGQLINAEAIDRVPLLTRNVYDLIQLSAGVTPANGAPNSSSSYDIQNISSGRPNIDVSSYTVNGAIVGSIYYMVDGSPIGVAENNAAAILPAMDLPEDAVDEVRVETQNTPATYQSGAAGVISVATKSGTEKFHGDVFGVFRPNVLAANEYFNKQSEALSGTPNTAPDFHRYQEGASIGGPLWRSKHLFFFADYEATQQQLYDGSNRFVVPTTAERSGDFSADPFTIYDPTQPDIATGPLAGTRQAVANNVITNPSPTATMFLSEMPKCNLSNVPGVACDSQSDDLTPNFFLPGLDPTTAQKFDIRVDWNLSERQRIFGRFSFARLFTSTFNSFGNMWDLNYAQNVTNARNILIGDDLNFGSSTVLSLRYSFTRHYEDQGGDPRQNGYDITQLGFPSSLAAQEVFKLLPFVIFTDNGSGVGGTANYNTFVYASENNDASATLTKTFGKHQISAGFEYMKRFLNVGQPPAPSGSYAFDITATDQTTNSAVGGSDFASFLFDAGTEPGTESNNYPNFTKDLFAAEASPYYAAFIEDTWRPSQSFTITAGLRWDIFGGRTERHNRLEYFNPTVSASANGVDYTGAEIYVDGNNRSPFTTNLKDFGPRLGFSWQPTKHVVFHGGAGIYYGPSPQMVGSASLNSDGYSTSTTWNATQWNNDPNTIAYDCANFGICGGLGNTTILNPLTNPFPNGVVQTINNPTGLANNLGISLNTMLHTQRTPTVYNFNFGYQVELPHAVVLSAAYVGSRGLFLPFSSFDVNQLDLGTIAKYQTDLMNQSVPNQWAAIQDPTNANYGSATVPLWVAVQPFPQFGNGSYGNGNGVIVHGYPAGDSEYHSLQTKVQKRLTSHFTTLSSFTWAKLMTDDGNPPLGFVGSHLGAPQDARNLEFEHSVSPQDVKYQFTGAASYDLPAGKGRALDLNGVGNAILGGWTLNGIFYWSTGIPIASPIVGGGNIYFNQRPDLACDPGAGAPHNINTWFNYNCFVIPASNFVAGNAPAYLDHVRTMGAKNLDLSMYKTFSFGETKNLRIEVSSYNIANRAQFGMPNVPDMTDVLAPPPPGGTNSFAQLFGQVTSTVNSPRQFQFGGRFTF
jgi:Carboxypeptidase regulatory-like domain